MSKITVSGGKRLFGVIEPSGSKNGALPIIFATLLNFGVSELYGVADIGDVEIAVKIVEHFGALVERSGSTLKKDTRNISYKKPPSELTSKIRASSYLMGACLARFGVFDISDIGGCNFCNRPLDMHVSAALSLGAELKNGMLYAKRLSGGTVKFDKKSVGATINALLMATYADSEVEITGAAEEPHVRALVDYLVSSGAKIEFLKEKIRVFPSALNGGSARIIPDMIEAGTYLLLAPLTEGRITVKRSASLELDEFFNSLTDAGISISQSGGDITAYGAPERPIRIKTAPHPGYPTDLQPQIAPLMAKYFGGIIDECVWQNRFSYLDTLYSFGVHHCKSNSRAVILPSDIRSGRCDVPDLRGGVAALMCALSANGESVIGKYEIIKRGYERLSIKLNSLGVRAIEANDKEEV